MVTGEINEKRFLSMREAFDLVGRRAFGEAWNSACWRDRESKAHRIKIYGLRHARRNEYVEEFDDAGNRVFGAELRPPPPADSDAGRRSVAINNLYRALESGHVDAFTVDGGRALNLSINEILGAYFSVDPQWNGVNLADGNKYNCLISKAQLVDFLDEFDPDSASLHPAIGLNSEKFTARAEGSAVEWFKAKLLARDLRVKTKLCECALAEIRGLSKSAADQAFKKANKEVPPEYQRKAGRPKKAEFEK